MLGVRLAEKKALSHDLNHVWKPLSLLPIHPNHVWKLLKPMGVMITLRRRRLGGVRRAKALTGWETRWELHLLPLLLHPLIYSSAGPRGFRGWPLR